MSGPLVTIGVALYNHQDYIVQCLRSLVEQSYENIEIIVIDDGSPDQSFERAKQYLDSQSINTNYTVKTRANKGMCNTLNEIAMSAKGEYISFIGSDDFWAPNKIEDQARYLDEHTEVALVHSNSMKVDKEGVELKEINYSNKKNSGMLFEAFVYRTGGINTPSHLYRTSIYKEIGYYDPNFRFEDTDFWLRLSKRHAVGYQDKVHTYYRWHGGNLSDGENSLKFYNEELIKIYKKNIDEPALLRYAVARMLKKSLIKAIKLRKFSMAKGYFDRLRRLDQELSV